MGFPVQAGASRLTTMRAAARLVLSMILNECYSFSDVRYLISSKVGDRMPRRDADGHRDPIEMAEPGKALSYDVELSFTEYPKKTLLPAGTPLFRLDFPISFGLFMSVWWMKKDALQTILRKASSDTAELRREWQHATASPKPIKGIRTMIIEIILTQDVYAWVGKASPLFHKKGGVEQVYLPNLSRSAGPYRSDFARLQSSYKLPV